MSALISALARMTIEQTRTHGSETHDVHSLDIVHNWILLVIE